MKLISNQKDVRQKDIVLLRHILLENLTRDGIIDTHGRNEDEILEELKKLAGQYEFTPIIDYTSTLLAQARTFRRTNKSEMACLFYALWIEHTLNGFISTFAKRLDFSDKEVENIIRETSYKAKFSWLLHLFDKKAFPPSHAKRITRLMEARNSFVHYKWRIENQQANKEITEILSNIEKTVKYIRYYEINYINELSSRKIKKITKISSEVWNNIGLVITEKETHKRGKK